MKRILFVPVLALVALLVASTIALAVAPAPAPRLLARGTLGERVNVNVPGVAKLQTKADNVDFVHVEITFAPGADSGWHNHPGPTLVSVKEGTITVTHGDCSTENFTKSQSWVEGHPGRVGRAVNNGTGTAIVLVTSIVPKGSMPTIPATGPTCPAGEQ